MSRHRWKARAAETLFWLAPPAFLLWLFHDGLNCWFLQDDFAWLGLVRQVHGGRDLLHALFAPAAQGTIRPWSERGFFLLFETLFGMDALPFRITAFATAMADLLLLAWIVRRVTNSPLAGFIASLCWAANSALVTVMAWNSAYNELMCAGFLLAAMALLIRYAETGKTRYWWAQFAVFVLGFGVLEINVVYPALAAAYALFAAPKEQRARLLKRTAPLVLLSIVYFAIHQTVAPAPKSGPYAIHPDARIFQTFLTYGQWSLLPENWEAFGRSRAFGTLIAWSCAIAIAALLILEAKKRRGIVLFFVCWYLAPLAPVLVLPGHVTGYYLTIPLLGLAMLFGFGATCGVRAYGSA
ncbi:MAG: glycosyltransferase family 39 protein, partial [Acidobacteriota bacterium]|nr:glycosyltransferase family 39 protein [Acidobacteriota bacterium]